MNDRIEGLLDSLNHAIRHGQYARLATLGQSLAAELDKGGALTSAQAASLREKCDRNAICLEAALCGLRAGTARLQEIRHAAHGLTTYDRTGTRALLAPPDFRSHRA